MPATFTTGQLRSTPVGNECPDVEPLTEQVGTPLCIPSQGGIDIGRIASMEINHVAVEKAKRGDSIALKVEATNTAESSRLYGRHFDHKV